MPAAFARCQGIGGDGASNTLLDIGRDKSSVDDFDKERGIVRTRVVLHYDLLRFSPRSVDLFLGTSRPPWS